MTTDWCIAEDLVTLLELERVDTDTWQGIRAVDVADWSRLYGGQVTARQDGEVVFSMSASFHVEEEGGVLEPPRPTDVPSPPEGAHSVHRLIRAIEVRERRIEDGRQLYSDRLWVRASHPLPADPMLHACVVTYLSDLASGFGMVTAPGVASAGASIDHALWFQRPARSDEWMLLDMAPLKAGGALGVYTGNVWGPDGLVATFAQEMLIRV